MEVATKVQVRDVDPAFVAVTVTVPPPPERLETLICGVLSRVMRSLSEAPVSDAASRLTTGLPKMRHVVLEMPTLPAVSVAITSKV